MKHLHQRITSAGAAWISQRIENLRVEQHRDPTPEEVFAIKQDWRSLDLETRTKKQARRQHKEACHAASFVWSSRVTPVR